MILESDHIIWRKARVILSSSYFEYKQMNPRKFGPYTLVKNHLEPYFSLSDEIVYPYILDFDGIQTPNSKYMVVGIIKKTGGQSRGVGYK